MLDKRSNSMRKIISKILIILIIIVMLSEFLCYSNVSYATTITQEDVNLITNLIGRSCIYNSMDS